MATRASRRWRAAVAACFLAAAGCAPRQSALGVPYWREVLLESKSEKARLAALIWLLEADAIEGMTLDEVLSLVARIVDAVEVPVSVDAESGYEDAGETAAQIWSRGAVGVNLEDGELALDAAVENVRAARRAAPEIVINARTDAF